MVERESDNAITVSRYHISAGSVRTKQPWALSCPTPAGALTSVQTRELSGSTATLRYSDGARGTEMSSDGQCPKVSGSSGDSRWARSEVNDDKAASEEGASGKQRRCHSGREWTLTASPGHGHSLRRHQQRNVGVM